MSSEYPEGSNLYEREQPLETVTCEFCKGDKFNTILTDSELAEEQQRAYELSRGFYRRATDAYVKAAISYTQSYRSNLVQCQRCGLIYRNPKPRVEFLLHKYRSEKFPEEYELVWRVSWERIFTRELERMESIVGGRRLLDIGSQFGLLPELAIKRGWDAFGVDICDYTVESAGHRGVKIFHGQLADAKFLSSSFDAVTIMLLFENLPHFPRELAEISRILKPGGLLVIKIANVAFYLGMRRLRCFIKPDRLKWYVDVCLCRFHLLGFPYQFGFTRQTITQVLSLAGFKAIAVRNYRSTRAFNLWLKPEIGRIETVSKFSVNTIASAVFWVSFRRLNVAPWLQVFARRLG